MSLRLHQLPSFHLGLSFWSGVSSLADVLGEATLPEADDILSGPEADRAALQDDLQRIGKDFQKVIAQVTDEHISE